MKRLTVPILLSLLLAGCATVSPVINPDRFSERLTQVEAIGRQPEADTAIKQYRDYIAAEKPAFDQPFSDYQTALNSQIQVLAKGGTFPAVIGDGIPHLFEARLDALVQAYRGLAAAQVKFGDIAGAENSLIAANSLIKSRAISPVNLSRSLSENYSLLKSIYAGQGESGKALLADLNINLSQDYLASLQGGKDARATRRALQDSREVLINVNFIIGDANVRAKKEALDRLDKILNVMSVTLNQYMASQRSAQSAASPQLRTAWQINDLVMQAAKAYLGDTSGQAALNPLGNLVTTRQLVDPDSGVNPQGIIKSFCLAAAALSGDARVGQGVKTVSTLLDGVMAVRGKGSPEKTAAAVQKFGEAFTSLQGLVAHPGKPDSAL